VTGQLTLEPESSGEVLVEVTNTEDVIDALDVDLGGIPGASVRIDSATPTLFPGERRRLTLRVELPARVPAGRHRAMVEIRAVGTGDRRSVGLDVDVPPRPALAAGAHPAVRRARRQVDFPVTVTNRGNTPLQVLVRELDVPDRVTVDLQPAEFDIAPWSSIICRARVTAPRQFVGEDKDHPVDLRITARATTPGRPLMETELDQEAQVTFRQRPLLSPGVLLAMILVTVAALWVGIGLVGLTMFIRLVDPGAAPAAAFFPGGPVPGRPDVAITVAGQMVSATDGSPVAGVTVLACSQETATRSRTCTSKTAEAWTVSDGNGRFWLPGLFPGPYRLGITGQGLKAQTVPTRWFNASCSLNQPVSAPSSAVTIVVAYHASSGPAGLVRVTARVAGAATSDPTASPSAPASSSPASSPSASATGSPTVSASLAPCTDPTTAPTSGPAASNGSAATPSADPSSSPTPSPTRNAWRGKATGADAGAGMRTATVVVTGLPAPGRYDLTVDAGTGVRLTVREVHVEAGKTHPVIQVTLPPSSTPTPSPS